MSHMLFTENSTSRTSGKALERGKEIVLSDRMGDYIAFGVQYSLSCLVPGLQSRDLLTTRLQHIFKIVHKTSRIRKYDICNCDLSMRSWDKFYQSHGRWEKLPSSAILAPKHCTARRPRTEQAATGSEEKVDSPLQPLPSPETPGTSPDTPLTPCHKDRTSATFLMFLYLEWWFSRNKESTTEDLSALKPGSGHGSEGIRL